MSPPPDRYTFFVDRCLGSRKVAQALRSAGVQVECHDDHFPPTTLDEQWVVQVTRRGWIILTQDRNIRRRKPELEALVESGAASFIITSASITGDEAAALFVGALPAMVRLLEKYTRPLIVEMKRTGDLAILRGERRAGVDRGPKHKGGI